MRGVAVKLAGVWAGKATRMLTRVLGAGRGTSLPGLVAESVDRDVIRKLCGKLRYGSIVITGTNGKTTTAKMLADILRGQGLSVLHNSSGSNLRRGISSVLVDNTDLLARRLDADAAVFEVDEAAMPEAIAQIRPRFVLVTNLCRDQLDRYGELDGAAALLSASLGESPATTAILNADDPLVASLARDAAGSVRYYGIEDESLGTTSSLSADSKDCVACGRELDYRPRYFGHLGIWRCAGCGAARVPPHYRARNVRLAPRSSAFELDLSGDVFDVRMPLPGLYNVYNALAAAAVAQAAGMGGPALARQVAEFSAAFGRMEELLIEGRKVVLLLIKNPVGANEALKAILSDGRPKSLLFALNDNLADGSDVSWVWDVDFESADIARNTVVTSGIRAEDMAVRLKYAGLEPAKITIEKDLPSAVTRLVRATPPGSTCFILPTYTAMTGIRDAFTPKRRWPQGARSRRRREKQGPACA